MFSQFFGGYLLNKGAVTKEQLAKALDEKKVTRMRLGVLAINAGLMTAEQVELVNVTQQTVDKRFGDLCVDMGYLKAEQVDELLSKQPTDYLLLGQTLVNMGALSNAEFETYINEYREHNQINDDDISDGQSDKLAQLVSEFYHFSTSQNAKLYTKYVSLLLKSLIRFVGDDFTPLDASPARSSSGELTIRQDITGAYRGITAISAGVEEYKTFAKRFAGEAYVPDPEFDDASVGEFLNVCNGLYAVNESNDSGVEISLTPLTTAKNEEMKFDKEVFSIPVQFTFGEIEFLVAF